MLFNKSCLSPGRTQISQIATTFILVPVLENGDSRRWGVVICRFKNCYSTFTQLLLTEHQGQYGRAWLSVYLVGKGK